MLPVGQKGSTKAASVEGQGDKISLKASPPHVPQLRKRQLWNDSAGFNFTEVRSGKILPLKLEEAGTFRQQLWAFSPVYLMCRLFWRIYFTCIFTREILVLDIVWPTLHPCSLDYNTPQKIDSPKVRLRSKGAKHIILILQNYQMPSQTCKLLKWDWSSHNGTEDANGWKFPPNSLPCLMMCELLWCCNKRLWWRSEHSFASSKWRGKREGHILKKLHVKRVAGSAVSGSTFITADSRATYIKTYYNKSRLTKG